MFIVAGPPGSGKSTAFPVAEFGRRYFNADDRAAQLNGGSYVGIPPEVRSAVNLEFEEFIRECIAQRDSFAIETTLRTTITFDQAQAAKARGFWIEMRYLALRDFAMHLERVKIRADAGGHSAPESQLRKIYESSLANLRQAIEEMDDLWIYDNSEIGGPPRLVAQAARGKILFMSDDTPAWLSEALTD